jgi:hypothetical protein
MASYDLPGNERLAELVQRQHGVVSSAQLEDAGISSNFARERVTAMRWQRVHRRVYATFSGGLDRLAAVWAAILRCGEDAVASHETAAELDGLRDDQDEMIHITVSANRRVRGKLDGVRVHYAHRLPSSRHPTRLPPRTRIEDTVLDLVDNSRTAARAAGWIVAAIQKRKTTPSRLAARLAGRKKIKWRCMAEAMLLNVAAGAHSMLEVEHLRRVERAHGLPAGERQRRVAGQRVIWIDVGYQEYDTRVELDGRVGHDDALSAFRDRQRDNRGTVGRQWTLRYGHADVFGHPCAVAAEQAYVLQQRGWAGEPRPCSDDCELPAVLRRFRDAA